MEETTPPNPPRPWIDKTLLTLQFGLIGPALAGAVLLAPALVFKSFGAVDITAGGVLLIVGGSYAFGFVPAMGTGLVVAIVTANTVRRSTPFLVAALTGLLTSGAWSQLAPRAGAEAFLGFGVIGAVSGLVCTLILRPWARQDR